LKKIIIAAIAKNGVIGRADKQMPWHDSEEFKHFKQTTYGYPIIMGRKTFESLGKPLKGRVNIVITKNMNWKSGFEEVLIYPSLEEAIQYCDGSSFEKIFITGGGELYKQAISVVDEMIISYMNFEAEGEVFFPEFDKSKWSVASKERKEKFEIVYYVRK
jgi:dihydrofolate reductase